VSATSIAARSARLRAQVASSQTLLSAQVEYNTAFSLFHRQTVVMAEEMQSDEEEEI